MARDLAHECVRSLRRGASSENRARFKSASAAISPNQRSVFWNSWYRHDKNIDALWAFDAWVCARRRTPTGIEMINSAVLAIPRFATSEEPILAMDLDSVIIHTFNATAADGRVSRDVN